MLWIIFAHFRDHFNDSWSIGSVWWRFLFVVIFCLRHFHLWNIFLIQVYCASITQRGKHYLFSIPSSSICNNTIDGLHICLYVTHNKTRKRRRLYGQNQSVDPGCRFNIKTVTPGISLKIRRSRDRLIVNMWIPILVKRHLYIKTAPCYPGFSLHSIALKHRIITIDTLFYLSDLILSNYLQFVTNYSHPNCLLYASANNSCII